MIKETRNVVDFGFKVGDILEACWGYEANIYNFYEVVGLTKTMVKIKELKKICAEEQSNYSMYYGRMVKPVTEGADRFVSDTIMRKPFNFSKDFNPKYSGVAINSYMYAYQWDGKACDEYNAH